MAGSCEKCIETQNMVTCVKPTLTLPHGVKDIKKKKTPHKTDTNLAFTIPTGVEKMITKMIVYEHN
jgi:hypothetical protein